MMKQEMSGKSKRSLVTERVAFYNADCVQTARQVGDNTVGLSVFSPPFGNLFVYSDVESDMGNCANDAEFAEHFHFLCDELYRVMIPGRIVAVHCSDLPAFKAHQGYIGLRDFSGDCARVMSDAGFVYHSRVTLWKSPVTEMQRTKAHGLLYKNLLSDSTQSRMGMPDYLLLFRKLGDAADYVPVPQTGEDFPLAQWQEWASPVWMDVNWGDTLNTAQARSHQDERHVCPLQLDIIRRLVRMYSNPDDVVYDPFSGIGSTGLVALQEGRRFLGSELKPEYFKLALTYIQGHAAQPRLF